ncbi:hypothetical protein FHS29_002102 [Saccharothrix tamanrassetensis]|uniref:Uncharacterized protein n=1 Tax=Saccharothrix tamanrassetensis TaxID=1051531 RepID=A0A841CE31_9PSEU|nr:hypothetical protein [Saccharothrix tamanrassetensis]MBB5955521.1 hypothetical protein [Saccharothrix tamanrassetensis]
MYRGSPVEVSTQVDIAENFTLLSAVHNGGEQVELEFSGGTHAALFFTRRGFEQFKQQWPAVVAKAEEAFKSH